MASPHLPTELLKEKIFSQLDRFDAYALRATCKSLKSKVDALHESFKAPKVTKITFSSAGKGRAYQRTADGTILVDVTIVGSNEHLQHHFRSSPRRLSCLLPKLLQGSVIDGTLVVDKLKEDENDSLIDLVAKVARQCVHPTKRSYETIFQRSEPRTKWVELFGSLVEPAYFVPRFEEGTRSTIRYTWKWP
ncbi:hypothetical protein AAVH_19873 [Aphelenchoides avenae]|nr:hypothetical protein AAVH_19873 [Aphelenchus avenae]